MTLVEVLEIVAAFLGGAAVAVGIQALLGHLRRSPRPSATAPASSPVVPAPVPRDGPDATAVPAPPAEPGLPVPHGAKTEEAGRPPAAPTIRLSARVIEHVYHQGRVAPGEIAPRSLTQAGMSTSLGASQSALAKVLRRLVIAGVLSDHRGHVVGEPTRRKFYLLTPLGETLARDMRRRGPPGRDPEEHAGSIPAEPTR